MVSKHFNIALVDDCAITRYLCRRAFETHGITVLYEADNGRDLFNQIEKRGVIPDGCLLDIDMPVMNGYQTAQWLNLLFPRVTVLAYSANGNTEVANCMLQCGAHGFIEKGSHPKEYVQTLLQLNDARFNAGHSIDEDYIVETPLPIRKIAAQYF